MEIPTIAFALGWLACAGLSVYLAIQRGRSIGEGLWIGLLFGPLGVVAVGALPAVDDAEEMRRLEERQARGEGEPVATRR